jgi:DNA-binding NarL/FixJ family response regulator
MVRMLIADDHPVMLAGLRRSLESDGGFEVVGEAHTGAQVLPLINQTDPEVILLDMRMPGMDGLGCLRRIRTTYPDLKVVMCSVEDNRETIQAAFRGGACGFIVKTVEPRDLGPAIRQAIEGTAYQPINSGIPGGADVARTAGLTEREFEIIKLVASGLSNKAIARDLWVTEQTVKFHLSNVYRKLGITNRTEAAYWAFSRGLNDTRELEQV